MIINPYLVQPGGPSFSFLLDTYSGAALAYSAARRLSSTYTGSLIRVRRSSDNTEQDIGYDGSNLLDESALTTFVGAGNGFVTTWYDQSGNGKNQTQSTAGNQPKIVSSGTIIKENSKPCIQFDGASATYMQNTTTGLIRLDKRSHFYVIKETSSGSYRGVISYAPSSGDDFSNANGGNSNLGDGSPSFGQFTINNSTSSVAISGSKPTPYSLFSQYYDATNGYVQKNNGSYSSAAHGYTANKFNTGGLYLGLRYLVGAVSTAFSMTGILQEMIIYNGDSQNSNMSAINTNINTFYSIY